MSSLDDKLQAWREATDVEPSAELLSRLKSSSAPSPAPLTAVKVIVAVVAVVVVAAVALYGWTRVEFGAQGGVAAVQGGTALPAVVPGGSSPAPGVRDGSVAPADGGAVVGLKACPPRSGTPALMATPIPSARTAARDAEKLLRTRPLTCEGQLAAIQTLFWARPNTADELARLRARRIFLCGADPREHALASACDESDWCRFPACDGRDRACLEQVATGPASSCVVQDARAALAVIACAALIRGEAVDAGVPPADWCLSDPVKQEVDFLRSKGAVPGSLPR